MSGAERRGDVRRVCVWTRVRVERKEFERSRWRGAPHAGAEAVLANASQTSHSTHSGCSVPHVVDAHQGEHATRLRQLGHSAQFELAHVVSVHQVGHTGPAALGTVGVVAAAAAVTQYAHSSHSGWPAPQMPTLHHAAQLMRFWQNEHGEHALPWLPDTRASGTHERRGQPRGLARG